MNDLISRQAAIMHFVKASKNYECGMFSLAEVTHELWEIASAQPEPYKEGKPMRLIDADALLDALDKSAIYGWSLQEDAAARRWAERVVELMPTEEPEIIRCKDCKYSDTFPENADNDMPLKCLGIRYGGVFPDWYCEHAERRNQCLKDI